MGKRIVNSLVVGMKLKLKDDLTGFKFIIEWFSQIKYTKMFLNLHKENFTLIVKNHISFQNLYVKYKEIISEKFKLLNSARTNWKFSSSYSKRFSILSSLINFLKFLNFFSLLRKYFLRGPKIEWPGRMTLLC